MSDDKSDADVEDRHAKAQEYLKSIYGDGPKSPTLEEQKAVRLRGYLRGYGDGYTQGRVDEREQYKDGKANLFHRGYNEGRKKERARSQEFQEANKLLNWEIERITERSQKLVEALEFYTVPGEDHMFCGHVARQALQAHREGE